MYEKNDRQRVLQELAQIAFCDASAAFAKDGTPNPEVAGTALASVEKTAQGLRLKFYDKLKALELLGKHYGLFDGNGGTAAQHKQGLLEAFLKEDGDVHLPESQAEAGHELVEPGDL